MSDKVSTKTASTIIPVKQKPLTADILYSVQCAPDINCSCHIGGKISPLNYVQNLKGTFTVKFNFSTLIFHYDYSV
jgi:hypothetical protein